MFTSGPILFSVRFRQTLWSTYANAGLTESSTPTLTQQCLCKTAARGRGQNIFMPFFLHTFSPQLCPFSPGCFLCFPSRDRLCFLFPFFSQCHLQHVKDELCPSRRFDQSLWLPLREMLLWLFPYNLYPWLPMDLRSLYQINGEACAQFYLFASLIVYAPVQWGRLVNIDTNW